jgi:hypothetical protein
MSLESSSLAKKMIHKSGFSMVDVRDDTDISEFHETAFLSFFEGHIISKKKPKH